MGPLGRMRQRLHHANPGRADVRANSLKELTFRCQSRDKAGDPSRPKISRGDVKIGLNLLAPCGD
jgi:hypothetical protein